MSLLSLYSNQKPVPLSSWSSRLGFVGICCYLFAFATGSLCFAQGSTSEASKNPEWGQSPFVTTRALSVTDLKPKIEIKKNEVKKSQDVQAQPVSRPSIPIAMQEIPELSAIWRGEAGYRALISQNIVKDGDKIGGLRVVKIEMDSVILRRDSGEALFLNLRKK